MSETVLQHPGQLLGGHLPVLPAGEYLSLISLDWSRDLNTDLWLVIAVHHPKADYPEHEPDEPDHLRGEHWLHPLQGEQ